MDRSAANDFLRLCQMEEDAPRYLFFGGRHFADRPVVYKAGDALRRKYPNMVLVHGHCPTGADALADQWAEARGVQIIRFPAKWNSFGKAAGPIRNQNMLEIAKPSGAVGFPGGDGTFDMRNRLDTASVTIWWPVGDARVVQPTST